MDTVLKRGSVFWVGLLLLPVLMSPSIRGEQETAWFSGGAYDGYDQARLGEGLATGLPQLNNAGGATHITEESVWLNGMLLEPGTAPAEVRVYWGESDGVTNTTAWAYEESFGSFSERESFTTNVSVAPGTPYAYRFYALDAASGEGWASETAWFITPSPPTIVAGAAAPVGRYSATLNGELLTGLSAAITVYWGQDEQAWSHTNHLGSVPEGAFRIALSALTPGTTYGFQMHAGNAFGDDTTDVEWFTTHAGSAWVEGGGYDGYDWFYGSYEFPARGTLFFLR